MSESLRKHKHKKEKMYKNGQKLYEPLTAAADPTEARQSSAPVQVFQCLAGVPAEVDSSQAPTAAANHEPSSAPAIATNISTKK